MLVGARRWILIGSHTFQPSELAKIGLIVFFAAFLSDRKEEGRIKKYVPGFGLPIVLLLPIIVAVFILQNHLSATLIILAVTFVQMFVAGTRIIHFLISGGIALLAGLIGIFAKYGEISFDVLGFRGTRFKIWKDPFSDPTGDGWQIIQSWYAIGSGGLFGLGLGKSRQKYLYLPEAHNDFIFAILAEEFGFVGCVVIILLFVAFIWRGIVIAIKAKDVFGCLIAVGIVTMLGLQALINIAVVTGTIPVTGMPLPFFSYGGTALIANLAAVGILLNISRSSK